MRNKKKLKKTIEEGIIHIQASFNNLIVTVTTLQGDTIAWGSSGASGFRGAKKTTPFAAQMVVKKCLSGEILRKAQVRIKGIGAGREAAVRAVGESGVTVTEIRDITGQPHNGCRPPAVRKP